MKLADISKENWNQDPNRMNLSIFASYGPKSFGPYSTPSHWHEFYEWLYVADGTGIVRLGQDGEHAIAKGDLIFVRPNVPHSFFSRDGVFIGYLQFHPELILGSFSGGNHPSKRFGHHNLPAFVPAEDPQATGWQRLMRTVYDECNSDSLGDGLGELRCISAILQIYVEAARSCKDAAVRHYAEKDLEWLYKLQDFVSQNYSGTVELKDVARRLNVSGSHLCRIMRKSMGQTFYEYLRGYRMYKAQQLISTTSMPITQVASECGYDNPSAFSRAFRQVIGISPAVFRKALS